MFDKIYYDIQFINLSGWMFMLNKVVLVTGASGEIGSAIALMLAKNNYHLILQYNENKGNVYRIKEDLKNKISVEIIQADLAEEAGVNKLFTEIKLLNLSPTILINCAGISKYGLIQDVNHSVYQKVMNANLGSTFFCSQQIIPYMLEERFGRIINISSIWGSIGAANEVLYSTTKGAINTFTKALAKELAPSGITVNAIAPGIVMSKMMAGFTQNEIDALLMEMPMNRFANPEEIAQAVLYLVSPGASYVTGQILTIDGGWI